VINEFLKFLFGLKVGTSIY